MGRLIDSSRGQAGFTIVEVLLASMILLVGMLGTVTLVDSANLSSTVVKAREQGTNLAREVLESARTIPYSQLNNQSIVSKVQAMPNLANASSGAGQGWTIQRRGVTYNVALGTCTVDDPSDGVAASGVDTSQDCPVTTSTLPSCDSLLLGGIDVSGNASVATQKGTLAGQVAIGQCGLSLTADGRISDLTQADASLCVGTACLPTSGLPADSTPDDYRRIIVLVTWTANGGLYYTRQATTEPNPGGQAFGPPVWNLGTTASLPLAPSYLSTTVPFTVYASSDAKNVIWSVDGTDTGLATAGTGGQWSFNWSIGASGTGTETLDGAYVIGARAVNSQGVAGAVSSVTVTLNRRQTYAPTGVIGGRNGAVVEFQWLANKERDIAGYRVYRTPPGSSAVKVCDVPTRQTNCQDTAPPSSNPVTYYVVALDHDLSGALREGDASATVTVTGTNAAPNPPTNLAASSAGSNTVLAWSAPAVADSDGDAIAFYRIYRDGTAYANRYDTTGGAATTYTDTSTGGVQHTYYVTAVDPLLAESAMVGPVTK